MFWHELEFCCSTACAHVSGGPKKERQKCFCASPEGPHRFAGAALLAGLLLLEAGTSTLRDPISCDELMLLIFAIPDAAAMYAELQLQGGAMVGGHAAEQGAQ